MEKLPLTLLAAVLSVLMLAGQDRVRAYELYQQLIPNGHQVPDPCNEGEIWYGVGHTHPEGGGQNNQFGLDLIQYSFAWTRQLCSVDSDQDGLTNGQELGDPTCTWHLGIQPPQFDTGITHPGIANNDTNCA